ncbi:Transposase [Serratia marcescens]|nr:Transposase [Serratia marcescens]
MTQRKQTKRRFSPEFKLEAIEQVTKYQQRAVDVALALDLDPSQLRKWIRQYEAELQGVTPAGVAVTPDQQRIRELEKQVRRLEEQNTILKKATALLMSDSLNGSR